MKILHVNKYLYRRGGAESYMEDVAALQSRDGAEVQQFGMHHPENEPTPLDEDLAPYIELDPAPSSTVVRVRSAARLFWNGSAATGIDHVLERFPADVAHLHNIYHHLSPSILRPLRRRGVATVMTLHDYKLACPTYRFLADGKICEACVHGGFKQAVRVRCKDSSLPASALLAGELALHTATGAYGHIGAFICPSRFMFDKMTEAGVYPDRLRHVPHFIDVDELPPPRSGTSGPVVYVGRLSPEKGVDVLVDAVALLGRPDVELHIAGEGPARADLERRASALGANVTFLGRLSHDGVNHLLRRASVMVLPSRWYENQPMVILEAFAAGLPVIGSDLGGIPELIEDGHDGFVVPFDDPASLAARLRTLADEPTLAARMGAAGRRKVEEHFSPGQHLAALGRVYAEVGAALAERG